MERLAQSEACIALVTLTVREIVLGIENIIFISIRSAKVPLEEQSKARTVGLALATISRMLPLLCLSWVMQLTATLLTASGTTSQAAI